MARLDDRITPVTPSEVLTSLTNAWGSAFGSPPSRSSVLVLLCQWALETGRGQAMHCYNLGNIKSNQLSGDWCFFRCNEIIGGKIVWFEPDDAGCCFRAYESLDTGALDYLTTLYKRFTASWSAVLAGDVSAFAHLLKVQNYYTADEGLYTHTLQSLFTEFSKTIPATAPTSTLPTSDMPDLYTTQGVQTVLKSVGFDPGVIDGVEGPNTQGAVRQFQSSHGLVADGVVGQKTRSALADAWNAIRVAV